MVRKKNWGDTQQSAVRKTLKIRSAEEAYAGGQERRRRKILGV